MLISTFLLIRLYLKYRNGEKVKIGGFFIFVLLAEKCVLFSIFGWKSNIIMIIKIVSLIISVNIMLELDPIEQLGNKILFWLFMMPFYIWFLCKPQTLWYRVSKITEDIFFDIEVYLKNSAFGSISSASISLIIVLSLGSVLILLFFIRFCLDIPVLLDISFQEMSFSKAISSILFQNSSENCFINRSFGKIRLFPIYVQVFTTISNDST